MLILKVLAFRMYLATQWSHARKRQSKWDDVVDGHVTVLPFHLFKEMFLVIPDFYKTK